MKYFYKKLELDVIASVYYPQEDSEMLADILLEMDLKGLRCLDMGTGSGLLAIVMAKKGSLVVAADISKDAVSAVEKNASKNNVVLRIRESDIFSNISEKFDLIVFNPPYLPCNSEERDVNYDGGENGRETIEKFIQQAGDHLNKGGKVLLLISSLSGESGVLSEFRRCGLNPKIIKRNKIEWEELIVIEAI